MNIGRELCNKSDHLRNQSPKKNSRSILGSMRKSLKDSWKSDKRKGTEEMKRTKTIMTQLSSELRYTQRLHYMTYRKRKRYR
jgi:hypothetical protein